MNLAKESRKKNQRRKRYRYEREHSISAVHIYRHENPLLGLQVCAILDDSSRMIIAGGEYVHYNTENTIKVIDELLRDYWDICPLLPCLFKHVFLKYFTFFDFVPSLKASNLYFRKFQLK